MLLQHEKVGDPEFLRKRLGASKYGAWDSEERIPAAGAASIQLAAWCDTMTS